MWGDKTEPKRDWTTLQFVQIKQANQIYHCKPRVGGDGPACFTVSCWRKPDGRSLQEPFTFHLFGARTTVATAASRLICLAAAWLALPGPLHLLLRMGLFLKEASVGKIKNVSWFGRNLKTKLTG